MEYIAVSLDDEKAKAIGEVISNETARKILKLLAKKNVTESEIAKELNLPLSTVSYNIKKLLDCKLIEVNGFYYSEKGNKVNVYRLAKKVVLITPKSSFVKLKNVLLTALAVFACSFAIKLSFKKPILAERKVALPIPESTSQLASSNYFALFFIAGAFLALIVYLLLSRRK